MQTGNGKIANLPNEIREELNYRLNDGEPGNELVAWLNAKPEVIEVINQLFDGRPISEQNLSHWRNHGYRVWHAHRTIVDETHALSGNSEVIAGTGINCEKLLLALTASYAEMIQRWIITPGEEMLCKLRVFKEITNAVPRAAPRRNPKGPPRNPARTPRTASRKAAPQFRRFLFGPRFHVRGPRVPRWPRILQPHARSNT